MNFFFKKLDTNNTSTKKKYKLCHTDVDGEKHFVLSCLRLEKRNDLTSNTAISKKLFFSKSDVDHFC